MERVILEGEELGNLRASFQAKQLAAAETQVADAGFRKLMTVTLIKHGRNVDADQVCMACGVVSIRGAACGCRVE